MWISLQLLNSDQPTIWLSAELMERVGREAAVYFGRRSVRVPVKVLQLSQPGAGVAYEYPLRIGVSQTLVSRLYLPDHLTYRAKIAYGRVELGPLLGLLLGTEPHRYTPGYMQKFTDRMGVYKQLGGLVCAFSHQTIDWQNGTVHGLYFHPETNRWRYGQFPIPTAVYRRNFQTSQRAISRLQDYAAGRLFNSYRFDKAELYEFLGRDRKLSIHLPIWEKVESSQQITRFTQRHTKAILKPVHLSRGRGICVLEASTVGFRMVDYRQEPTVCEVFATSEDLLQFLEKNQGFRSRYLIQKHINLAQIGNSRFDIRLVMQKTRPNTWDCSGVECRVGPTESMLTNIARGGYALTIERALRLAFPDRDNDRLLVDINDLGHAICARLDEMGEHFGEFGLDIAVDNTRRLWILEVNVFPSFKGFKLIDYLTYLRIRYNPLLYALQLSGYDPNGEDC